MSFPGQQQEGQEECSYIFHYFFSLSCMYFPFTILVITIMAILGQGLINLFIALCWWVDELRQAGAQRGAGAQGL